MDNMNQLDKSLGEVTAFLNREADMLDYKEYDEWLKLWSDTGLYIVPIAHGEDNYKDMLNLAYDNAEMRKLRIQRLQSGHAMSAKTARITIRTLSRIRILDESDDIINVRCAYCLYENKSGQIRHFPANLRFKLRRDNGTLKIEEKIVELMNSDTHLATIAYLF